MKLNKEHTTIICISSIYDDCRHAVEIIPEMLERFEQSKNKEQSSMKFVPAYTTLPMEKGETNGKTYIHLAEMPKMKMSDALLYRHHNGIDYWMKASQLKCWNKNIIMCDRADVDTLRKMEGKDIDGWSFDLVTVDVRADKVVHQLTHTPDYVIHADDKEALDVIFIKVKMLYSFLSKKNIKKGQEIWL